MATQELAAGIVKAIKANVDAFYADKRTYETFSFINQRLWNAAHDNFVAGAVQKVFREES